MDGTGADVESYILHGGNTFVPFVQPVAKNAVASAKLATNVDADKAYELCAAFYGTSLSLYLCHTTEHRGMTGTLAWYSYQGRNRAGEDLDYEAQARFDAVVGFEEPASQPSSNVPTPQYMIMGVKALTLFYSESGLANITEAAMVGTVKEAILTSEIESLFGGEFFRTLDTDWSTVSVSEGTKVEGELKKPVEKLESSEITPSLERVITKPRSLEEKKAGGKRLISNAAASTRHEREEGFNGLEGLPYRFRCLPSDLGESLFNGFSIGGERAKVKEAIHGSMNPSPVQAPSQA
ncbi:hypothetical protein RSOLAG22IIIB_06692 [Rhizoctonia solani]|uniref:Uncharacterized protein n=1 Tax=Rhizoctonia solani TaxID=456999 RepID=A0A0K6GGQ4_9AGAM|nr:hypothetical protein RSOLAG22IIIB_06692 [Rhizoctonia solani]